MTKYLQSGTLIHGTMRSEDLIPAFIEALEAIELSPDEKDEVEQIKTAMQRPGFYDSEDADWSLNEVLFYLLNEHCPEDHYFGNIEGDGSDYGCWPCSDGSECAPC
jgi:hypothetical protein